ncbi:MAG: quinolinate synthase NadA [Lachnospiraceae bacterium]|nr:quinolinate synthase NadA [Lachnospiraceae bacterium]
MMNIHEMQQEIIRLKKEKDICILAHSYQAKEIIEIADFTGDSYVLSVKAKSVPQKTVIMCGVKFMAETVKMLSPEKTVIMPNPTAGCPMAEQMDVEYINSVKKEYPDYSVVAYVNTTAALKTIADVCVTSASAVNIVKKMPEKNILFIPDCNLGDYVAKQLPDKNIKLLKGGCPAHGSMRKEDVIKAKEEHPNALFLVHPECPPEVVSYADYVGSTSGIMKYAEESDAKEFIIGTENSIAELLSYQLSEKKFYFLSKDLICADMKATTLVDVYQAVLGIGGGSVELDKDTIEQAVKCIERMIELGD